MQYQQLVHSLQPRCFFHSFFKKKLRCFFKDFYVAKLCCGKRWQKRSCVHRWADAMHCWWAPAKLPDCELWQCSVGTNPAAGAAGRVAGLSPDPGADLAEPAAPSFRLSCRSTPSLQLPDPNTHGANTDFPTSTFKHLGSQMLTLRLLHNWQVFLLTWKCFVNLGKNLFFYMDCLHI